MVFLQSELTRQGKGKESSGRSSGAADCRRGSLEELNRIYEPDSAMVPKGLFGRDAQFARDIFKRYKERSNSTRVRIRISIIAMLTCSPLSAQS